MVLDRKNVTPELYPESEHPTARGLPTGPELPAMWIVLRALVLTCVGCAGLAHHASAQQTPPQALASVRALVAEAQSASDAFFRAIKEQPGAAELRESHETLLRHELACARRLAALGRDAPGTQAALEAWAWVLLHASDAGRRTEAATALGADHIDDSGLAYICRSLAFHENPAAASILDDWRRRSTNPLVQANATYSLARCLTYRVNRARALALHEPAADPAAGPATGPATGPDAELDAPTNLEAQHAADEARARTLLEQVLATWDTAEYARGTPAEATRTGPRTSPKRTLGYLAREELPELQTLTVGQEMPALEGPDLDGEVFRLDETTGKVVVLAFWSARNTSTLKAARALCAEFAELPFRFVGINTDSDPQHLLEPLLDEHPVPWRSFRDGRSQTMSLQLNESSHGPAVWVLDGQGIIRFKRLSLDDARLAVLQLLAEGAPTGAAPGTRN
jgi:hypothetical protein